MILKLLLKLLDLLSKSKVCVRTESVLSNNLASVPLMVLRRVGSFHEKRTMEEEMSCRFSVMIIVT